MKVEALQSSDSRSELEVDKICGTFVVMNRVCTCRFGD